MSDRGEVGEMGQEAGHALGGEELRMAIAAFLKPLYGSIGNLEITWEVTADAPDGTPGDITARCTFTKLE